MAKEKEIKTNAMRILDRQKIALRIFSPDFPYIF